MTPLESPATNLSARRICIDGRSMEAEGTGVSTYTRSVIAAIKMISGEPLILRSEGRSGLGRKLGDILFPHPWPIRLDRSGLYGLNIFRRSQSAFSLTGRVRHLRSPGLPGIMHWTYPQPLMVDGWINIYTVHDLIPLMKPELSPVDGRRHARLLNALSAQGGHFVTVSETSRDEIIEQLRIAPSRVTNCGQAVPAPLPGKRVPASDCGHFIFCGRIEPRKNLSRLIRAHRSSGTDRALFLVGPVAEGGDEILAELGANPRARYLGYLSRSEMLILLADARALLFPSLAEGFGLPVIEAMHLGTPVLISEDPALMETAGGAALSVQAEDEVAMAAAIARLAVDDEICRDLARKGRARVEGNFDLRAFANRLDRLYSDVAA